MSTCLLDLAPPESQPLHHLDNGLVLLQGPRHAPRQLPVRLILLGGQGGASQVVGVGTRLGKQLPAAAHRVVGAAGQPPSDGTPLLPQLGDTSANSKYGNS
eukprot:scaffold3527_cov70-Phaeocystis_antarctica.AAC.3